MKEIKADLIELAKQGSFNVIAHGCNCFCTMGAGIAVAFAKNFNCNGYSLENPNLKGDINKLGQIDYRFDNSYKLYICNAYTQYYFGNKLGPAIDYDALRLCMRKINHVFKGKRIGLPKIGCGLAGGIWNINELTDEQISKIEFDLTDFVDVKTIIQQELKDMDITVCYL